LGTAFGIGIYVHWTFLLLLGYVFFKTLDFGPPAAVFMMALVLAVFACVVLHELGHALAARRFGIGTRDITLYPIGGVARLERMSERPMEELVIAMAGPAVNVVIACLLFGLLWLAGSPVFHDLTASLGHADFLSALLVLNLWLVLFNLVPAFPMDGGRVLRALLALRLGHVRATRIAAALGVVMAALMLIWGFAWDAPTAMLVAVFVFFAGQQELAAVLQREEERRWASLQPPAIENGARFSGFTWDGGGKRWIIWRDGRPVQTISME
jgi:Zn-dependent protease